jgi:hypothetical protein
MKPFKKLAGAAAVAAMIGFAAPASAIIVGGIDFGVIGSNPLNNHLETATVAQTFINGIGQAATAYGVIQNVNGDQTYCADGSANCALYYVTQTTTQSFTPLGGGVAYATLGNSTTNVYLSAAAGINLLNQDSTANLAFITALPVWASFVGQAGIDAVNLGSDQNTTIITTGLTQTATGSGLASVNTGDGLGIAAVETYLNTNGIATFGPSNADIAFTTSSNDFFLNPNDLASTEADSCFTANRQVGDYCFQGTANFRGGAVVPEPGSLALLGVGLIGLVVSRRKVSSAL